MSVTYKICISGQVQGVGFRPFVYNLAHRYKLTGTVSNNEEGVIIYLNGPEASVKTFYEDLTSNPPPVSRIKDHTLERTAFMPFDEFQIIPSEKHAKLNLQLTPDFALCNSCQSDLRDNENRRFAYPFTTCVNCGPRWAITETFPFERHNTSIEKFRMCTDCMAEYTDPSNRRFHSQTNSCPVCGIKIEITNAEGKSLAVDPEAIFTLAAGLISEGKILAIKNTSGYLLCCDGTNADVVRELRRRKKRPAKPLAVLYPSREMLEMELNLNTEQLKSLSSSERPIVIISSAGYKGDLALDDIAPGLKQLGVMLPYTGVLQLLADRLDRPVVATSGNLHGSPILSTKADAVAILGDIADHFIHHDLDILNPQDDSVVKFSNKFNKHVMFRRSRGYAPNFYGTDFRPEACVLALGAQLKSSIAMLPNDFLYLSQYLGNLENYEVSERFEKTVRHFINLFEEDPEIVLVDSHPGYFSNRFGKQLVEDYQAKVLEIQHHKAHFAAVLGENDLFDKDEKVMGVIWDGTGYGDDEQIWGGEFFAFESAAIRRIDHFKYFNWLAGDKMSKEPRLSLFSLFDSENDIFQSKFSTEELNIYRSLKKKNKLMTSSVGRLFDAMASMLGLCDYNTYEGEAAIILENQISTYRLDSCQSYNRKNGREAANPFDLITGAASDHQRGVSKVQVILNFLYSLAEIIFLVADRHGFRKIAMSGGVFQNTTLIDMICEMAGDDYELYFNLNLAPNDENIAFGQTMMYLNDLIES